MDYLIIHKSNKCRRMMDGRNHRNIDTLFKDDIPLFGLIFISNSDK